MSFVDQTHKEFKDQAVLDLQIAVNRFNQDLAAWEARTGANATFGWKFDTPYTGGVARSRLFVREASLPIIQAPVETQAVKDAFEAFTMDDLNVVKAK